MLDVGAGAGGHFARFLAAGLDAEAIDIVGPRFQEWQERWHKGPIDDLADRGRLFDLVWCSHVLEHLPDVGHALRLMRQALKPAGRLYLTVPPMKPNIVGGHVNLFNLGLLAYRLVLAGFDCCRASFGRYGYNLSAIVERQATVPAVALASLRHDRGDIETLAPYFPESWDVHQGFDGDAVPDCGEFV